MIIGDAEMVQINARTALLLACSLVVAALTTIALLLAAGPRSTPTATDEGRVRAVLDGMNGSYNRSDFAGFASHLCPDILRAGDYEAGWRQSRKSDGPTHIVINSVDVTGDDAVANVRFEAANHEDTKTLDVDFLRDGTEWKACRYHGGRYI